MTFNPPFHSGPFSVDMTFSLRSTLLLTSDNNTTLPTTHPQKISDALYQQLRLRPESDLTTHELACLRCHEATLAPKRELESTRRTLQDAQAGLQEAQKRASDAESTLTRLTRQNQLSGE